MRTLRISLLILANACACGPGVANPASSKAPNSWLPATAGESSKVTELDDFLASVRGGARLLACNYNGNQLSGSHRFESGKLQLGKTQWTCDTDIRKIPGSDQALDIKFDFKLNGGDSPSSGVAVAFDFRDWSTGNYVLIPAAVYNGNRCMIVPRGYSSGIDRKYLYKKDLPLMSVPIPQLAFVEGQRSRLDLTSSNVSTPAMCFFNPRTKRAFIVLTEQGMERDGRMINNGFTIEENEDRSTASFVVSAPGVRERKPLFVGFASSPDRGLDLKAGDSIALRMRVYSFPTENIPGLLDKMMTVRKEVTGENQPRELIPFSQVAEWMTQRIDSRWHNGKTHKFYCPENAQWISFGWIGGLINTFPMISLGDDMHLDRVCKTFDFAIPRAQGDSGYFYGAIDRHGKVFGREGYNDLPELVLTRKNADVLYWMVKQFELLKAQGKAKAIKPVWEENIQRLAEAFVKTWRADGMWGRMIHTTTGHVAELNTSGGVMAIGGLAKASEYYERPEYLKVAIEAAGYYYENDFVKTGQTTGGCADIMQNADAETAAAFTTALMTLYEVTGDKRWLEKSRNLANLTATWTCSFDYQLPEDTELARLGAKLTGTYWASTQNKHAAPGVCTQSGDAIFKIYRATGDRRYGNLIRDIVRCHAESIRPGGFTNERLTYCDADGRHAGSRGRHVTGWNELNGFLMAIELPGIYLRTDKDELLVLDHVRVRLHKTLPNSKVYEITNPTKHDASVSVLADTAESVQENIGSGDFLKWPKVKVPAGASIKMKVSNKGRIDRP